MRARVRSFIFGGKSKDTGKERKSNNVTQVAPASASAPRWQTPIQDTPSPASELDLSTATENQRAGGSGFGSRPASMILFSNNPPLMTHAEGTPPELSPIFTYLNIHTNKVYQEGYFLKLNDQDSHGRPSTDRRWAECYAQLVGTVLSLWDAAALDAAGGEEVPATFINLTDASLKMLETLPIRNGTAEPLKNVLSLSSAGKNRYLLHFSSYSAMVQWTAAIRLAMYEHTSLYEAYTGSLIAAKGKSINGIQSILAPIRYKHEDWARVRFGAGTPWKRCWFVISPPDEKEVQKAKKLMKKSAYDRLSIPVTGTIKFYETRKTKKVTPIATVTQVYSAYAIYPQAKALIDQSTLVKLEGRITMNSTPHTATEGFVFVMPELHNAVSGFEMMLRFLFPVFDTFNLYGRPTRLVADTNHIKSIMFAFPKQRRYGYLEVLDIAALLQTPGSQRWSEAEWRNQLKDATQKRMSAGFSRTSSVASSQQQYRSSVPADASRRHFASKPAFNQSAEAVIQEVPRNEPPTDHSRPMSDDVVVQHGGSESARAASPTPRDLMRNDENSEAGQVDVNGDQLPPRTPPFSVVKPPEFSYGSKEVPLNRPEVSSEQRSALNRMSLGTLDQLVAVRQMGMSDSAVAFHDQKSDPSIDQRFENRAPSNNSSPKRAAYKNSPLVHASSDESIDLAVAMSQSQAVLQRFEASSPQQDLGGSSSIKRKPLPQRQLFHDEGPLSPGEPSFDDLRHTVDEAALDRIAPRFQSPVSPEMYEAESNYDDAASNVTPDYASTHESVYSRKSVKSVTKPRMGIMKTVGQIPNQDLVIGDAIYSTDKPPETNSDIPMVDFGPTLTYMPTTGRPSTGDALKKASHQRKESMPLNPRAHSRSPSQDEFRRNMLWKPLMGSSRPATPGATLTAEEFVQQRAAPSPPVLMPHTRNVSTSTFTPATQRPVSGDWTQMAIPRRPVSGDWTQMARPRSRMNSLQDGPINRPSSRGTSTMLNYNDSSTQLSAREQQYVARMTGSSFFNIQGDKKKAQAEESGQQGLVSAIGAREREKREFKEGMSNHLVQHAIAQRQSVLIQQQQQQQHQQEQQRQQQQQFASPYGASSNSVYQLPQPHGHSRQQSMYTIPTASHTLDALHQPIRPNEPRRQSWYGQLAPASQTPPPQAYQQQHYPQQGYSSHLTMNF
ncbi:hypothetical protein N7495_005024 [Penicillium taxi]|uniref:uncharacterized protein n=1 Tax=Penicillium taxi TaxID=168475 RepID=UPI0025457625|nr:uncharacterized protein N7495_005024 [Penicillium taxi]KAJ5893333.1 hypothetical protein N7495_005024 [Penicillium taxi]